MGQRSTVALPVMGALLLAACGVDVAGVLAGDASTPDVRVGAPDATRPDVGSGSPMMQGEDASQSSSSSGSGSDGSTSGSGSQDSGADSFACFPSGMSLGS